MTDLAALLLAVLAFVVSLSIAVDVWRTLRRGKRHGHWKCTLCGAGGRTKPSLDAAALAFMEHVTQCPEARR